MGVILLSLCFAYDRSDGQIYLTGLLQTGAGSNGDTAGSPVWNTFGNEVSYANLYVTQPNAGFSAPFLNSGNGGSASISYALTPGNYQFYFYSDAFANNNPGYYALSVFFDGNNNTTPGISSYSAVGVSSATAVPFGLNTLPLSGSTNFPAPPPGTFIPSITPIPGPGSLTYTADDLVVTLTSYGFGMPGAFGVPLSDRVSNLDNLPNGDSDAIGLFVLTVAPVPEPSAVGLGILGVVGCFCFRSLRRAGRA